MVLIMCMLLMGTRSAFGVDEVRWVGGLSLLGVDGEVSASLSWDPDGAGPMQRQVILGGRFSVAGPMTVRNLAVWNGSQWSTLGEGVNFEVLALAQDPVSTGVLFAAGRRWRGSAWEGVVARWDSSVWTELGRFSGEVRTLAHFRGELIAGGAFGAPFQNLARLGGSGWRGVGAGVDAGVNTLLVHEGALIVGGSFRTAQSLALPGVGRWDGTSWSALGAGLSGGETAAVRSLTIFQGTILAAGSFSRSADEQTGPVARWDGSRWRAFPGNLPATLGPRLIGTHNGILHVAGKLSYFGIDVAAIFRWDGEIWTQIVQADDTGIDGGSVNTFSTLGGGMIYGGRFFRVSLSFGKEAANVAIFENTPLPLGQGIAARANAVARDPQGRPIWTGAFGNLGQNTARILRWDDGIWSPVQPANSGGGFAITAVGDSIGFAGGGVGIIRPSGNTVIFGDPVLSTAPFIRYGVARSVAASGSLFVVAGEFAGFYLPGYTHTGCIAALDLNWPSSTPRPYRAGLVDGAVLGVTFDGDRLVAVGYTGQGSVIRERAPSGWETLAQFTDSIPRCVAMHGQSIVVGGDFINLASSPRIAVYENGSWRPLGNGFNGTVRSVHSFDGSIYAGGDFTASGNTPIAHLARWDGVSWRPVGRGTNGPVLGISSANNELVIAGDFTTVDGRASRSAARFRVVCEGDFNADRVTDFFDYLDFFAAFVAMGFEADFDRNGMIDFFDYLAFAEAYSRCAG
jgi:trimeric autotransporter adhesin